MFAFLHKSTLIGNKLVFPKSSLFCLWQWLVNNLPVVISTHELSYPSTKEEQQVSRWVGVWLFATANPPQYVYNKYYNMK